MAHHVQTLVSGACEGHACDSCFSFPTCCFQAMRFPPKSYNKDLESAEVRQNEGWTFQKEVGRA